MFVLRRWFVQIIVDRTCFLKPSWGSCLLGSPHYKQTGRELDALPLGVPGALKLLEGHVWLKAFRWPPDVGRQELLFSHQWGEPGHAEARQRAGGLQWMASHGLSLSNGQDLRAKP